jgi:hypothetical protein
MKPGINPRTLAVTEIEEHNARQDNARVLQNPPAAPPRALPLRQRLLPPDAAERKQYPVGTGVLDYFPDALAEVAKVSFTGNQQHNPGQPLHWARGKSMDHSDTIIRHYIERGTLDIDGMRHTAKLAWRVLALLQQELEAEFNLPLPRGATE